MSLTAEEDFFLKTAPKDIGKLIIKNKKLKDLKLKPVHILNF